MPKYYPINEEAAKRAKDMNSFSDYQPGSATAGYRAMVDEAYAAAERQKARVDPMYHDKIDTLVDRYARKLAENLNERNVIDARVPSILISGGGNFPRCQSAAGTEKATALSGSQRQKNVAKKVQSTSRTPPGIATMESMRRFQSCLIKSALLVWAGSAQTMIWPWKS